MSYYVKCQRCSPFWFQFADPEFRDRWAAGHLRAAVDHRPVPVDVATAT